MKVKLIKVLKAKIEFGKGIYDSSKGLAREYRRVLFFKKFKHNYEIEAGHIKTNPKGKSYVFIDENARKSTDLQLSSELDVEKKNKLDYLTEAAFWESMNLRKHDIVMILICVLAGTGLYSILRMILSMYGYYVP